MFYEKIFTKFIFFHVILLFVASVNILYVTFYEFYFNYLIIFLNVFFVLLNQSALLIFYCNIC